MYFYILVLLGINLESWFYGLICFIGWRKCSAIFYSNIAFSSFSLSPFLTLIYINYIFSLCFLCLIFFYLYSTLLYLCASFCIFSSDLFLVHYFFSVKSIHCILIFLFQNICLFFKIGYTLTFVFLTTFLILPFVFLNVEA